MGKIMTEVKDRTFIIAINRPEVRNCVDGETASLLEKARKTFRDDAELYVAILAGMGEKAFCAGADLKNLETLGPGLDANRH